MKNIRVLIWTNTSRIRLKFKGSCLKKEQKTPYNLKIMVNLFIFYELITWSQDLNTEFTLKDCFFGAVKLTKNADTDKCQCNSYHIGFDSQSVFSLPDGSMGKNVFIFGASMS